jgi:hypothetical protein
VRYQFECSCGAQQEWSGPCDDKPETIACPCGKQAEQLLCVNFVVRKSVSGPTERQVKEKLLDRAVQRTAQQGPAIKARDGAAVDEARKQERAARSMAKKGSQSVKRVAELPRRWVAEKLMLHGNEYFQRPTKDLKREFKQEGLLLNE